MGKYVYNCVKRLYIFAGGTSLNNAYFGQGSGPIFMDEVRCGSNDTALLACPYDPNTAEDSHQEDAGVRCGSECFTPFIHECICFMDSVLFIKHFIGSSFLY